MTNQHCGAQSRLFKLNCRFLASEQQVFAPSVLNLCFFLGQHYLLVSRFAVSPPLINSHTDALLLTSLTFLPSENKTRKYPSSALVITMSAKSYFPVITME